MRLLACSCVAHAAALALASSLACARVTTDPRGALIAGTGSGSGPVTEGGARLAQVSSANAANPLGGGGAVELEAVPPPAAPHVSSRRVYACVGGGGPVTFSDRPCGPSASVRDLAVIAPNVERDAARSTPAGSKAQAEDRGRNVRNSARAGESKDARALRPPDAAAGSHPGASNDAARNLRCDRLREAVEALDQHMRAGYTAREAGRLWTRWREAKERLRKAGC